MKLKIMMAQIETKTGDMAGNTKRVIEGIFNAIKEEVDIVVFPETAITGYCAGGLFNDKNFVRNAEKYLHRIKDFVPMNLVVVIGSIRLDGLTKTQFPILYNSAFVIQNQKIISYTDKYLLANEGHHEDKKYFESGDPNVVHHVVIRGKFISFITPICEDIWDNDHYEDVISEIVAKNECDLILVPNQSFFCYGKMEKRHTLVYRHVAKHKIPMVYVNSVGVGDIVKNIMIFDGGSFSYDGNGRLANISPRYEQSFNIAEVEVYPTRHYGKVERNIIHGFDTDFIVYKYEEIYNALIFAQRKVFEEIGLKKAQVHLSGGIDSALVGTIVAHAMGKENTIFITNPTKFNSEKLFSLAEQLAENLEIELLQHDIESSADKLYQEYCCTFGNEPSSISYGSSQAIIRTAAGVMATHHFQSGIVATGNHTEIVLGWATFHDIGSIGVHALIGDLTKVEVFQLSKWINEKFKKEIIPSELYDGRIKPHAELGDNDGDPFDYYVVSGIAALLIRERFSPQEIINLYNNKVVIELMFNEYHFPLDFDGKSLTDRISFKDFEKEVWRVFNLSKKSVFKAAQGAPIVVTSPRSRGFSNRETIFNFYTSEYIEL